MRDEYVGDVGDFGKYILLNELSEIDGAELKIGINWYYNIEPEYGMFRYLFHQNAPQFRALSQQLFVKLETIVADKRDKLSKLYQSNGIKRIQADSVLPRIKTFYDRPIKIGTERSNWFDESLVVLKDADVVFLDPDNGIEISTIRSTHLGAVKYVFMDEIKKYYDEGKSIIIYNHKGRTPLEALANTCVTLCDRLQSGCIIIKHARYQVRYYVFVPRTPDHKRMFKLLSDKLTTTFRLLFEFDEELNDLIKSKRTDTIIWPQ